eukprot:TRINITY_DN5043_c0_g1_i3.p1 TRINITY_DN5043_c0_g1~~TRINITY_DN5043_c0_g1_i3.p1  ORF type:complete len:443 (-),score=128.96 TRINITY_DN5043_c0_g1_i3:17-1345(-)
MEEDENQGDAMEQDDDAEINEEEEIEKAVESEEKQQEMESAPKKVWKPGQSLGENEVLEYDSSAYDMLHALTVEWPCLSFDIIRDNLGFQRTRFPHTTYFVAGTQADKPVNNTIVIMKVSQLNRTKHDNESDDEEEEDGENLDDDPIVEFKQIKHLGGVNRIRVHQAHPEYVATWADNSQVHIFNIKQHLTSLDTPQPITGSTKPIFSFKGHQSEGYAMDWSTTAESRFLTGDCKGLIYGWEGNQTGFVVDSTPYTDHKGSVEDLQWSPKETNVFASCSADHTVKIWDARTKKKAAMSVEAHNCDVNVISWNRQSDFLIASGADDGSFNIWDLRNFKNGTHVAHMKWHSKQITSIEWHPTEAPALAVAGADNQISTWDMSLEHDDEVIDPTAAVPDFDVPPQLLFCHQGQKDVKEIHWHPQIPGVILSTASDGFNIYKSCNM